MHMLTKVMAKALAPEIAVNVVAPGMIDLGEKAAKRTFLNRMAKQTPMQRNGRAEGERTQHSGHRGGDLLRGMAQAYPALTVWTC